MNLAKNDSLDQQFSTVNIHIDFCVGFASVKSLYLPERERERERECAGPHGVGGPDSANCSI